jgi:hypothetical protein
LTDSAISLDNSDMNGWDFLVHVADDGMQLAVAFTPLAAIWLRDFLKRQP